MEKRIKYNILLLLILFFVVPMQAQQKRKEKGRSEFSDGTTDRKIWVDALYKIAFPVIHNLAEGTLSKNMPVETSPDYGLDAKKVTYLEAVGRTLAGIAPCWNCPMTIRKKEY
ncbi:hypothetical protein JCM6292_1813 [Bacteroides pyogenes JCM 6292]|uniref:DUF2264 domain-containing protein n=1 Tax=Bacteroides pyogenes JCM 6292 TaxID=1235809 RepID=W4P718_9BACE|nr:hypothetical protein JCM6292_1813 [Bacteroides pyogenes JCM 6292]